MTGHSQDKIRFWHVLVFFCIASICIYRNVVYKPSKSNIQRKIFKQKDQHFPQMSSLKRCKYIFFNSSNINCSTSFSISVIIDASFKKKRHEQTHEMLIDGGSS